ncbi:hypothetical protein JOB18_016027 [Solea senegalensis]|uniref:Interleukin n=1 Tax=Solea senegalensis TaxID=28829 RepID=A0AAV6SLE7_SOLSE|nr:hypothetical protein JOB18_016027 [Solea senegalensis]
MFLLVGCLDTTPIPTRADDKENNAQKMCLSFSEVKLDYSSLLEEVSCGQNVNFTSPTNVEEACYAAALQNFMNGLENASINCGDQNRRIDDFTQMMELGINNQDLEFATTSKCKWESKQFTNFVKDLQSFVQQLANYNHEGCH